MQVWDKEQRVFVPSTRGQEKRTGTYSAMYRKAFTVRKLIEEHRDKMLTIRRRDFEVGKPLLVQPCPDTAIHTCSII